MDLGISTEGALSWFYNGANMLQAGMVFAVAVGAVFIILDIFMRGGED
jgi:hypothetical protein